jgi:hypothetical protein
MQWLRPKTALLQAAQQRAATAAPAQVRDTHTHPVSLTACTVCCYRYLHGSISITRTGPTSPTSLLHSAGAAAGDDAAAAGSGAAGGNGTSTSSASIFPLVHCIPTIAPNSRHASVFLVQQVESAAVDICICASGTSSVDLDTDHVGVLQASQPQMTLRRQAAARPAATAQALVRGLGPCSCCLSGMYISSRALYVMLQVWFIHSE